MAASLDCCGHVTSRNWSQVSRRGNISRDIHGDTKYSSASKATSTAVKMNGNLSTNKIILVITIVIGCFAILWPTVFYPMLQAAFATQSTSKQVPYTDRTGARGWFTLLLSCSRPAATATHFLHFIFSSSFFFSSPPFTFSYMGNCSTTSPSNFLLVSFFFLPFFLFHRIRYYFITVTFTVSLKCLIRCKLVTI